MIEFKLDKTINITFKTDIWSIGIVIYELLTLKRPFKSDNEILSLDTPNLELNEVNEAILFKNLIYMYIQLTFLSSLFKFYNF